MQPIKTGTIITEGKDGITNNINVVRRNEFGQFHYVDILVKLAEYYGFDGWFINIESPLPDSLVPELLNFVKCLKLKIHERIPHGKVIWYDSLTIDGEIKWQNRLNQLNLPFFNVADGIFINYFWSVMHPRESAILAKERARKVYTGIDIWGRNTYGGGGYDTYKALQVIADAGTSCALFAPAWTYESKDKSEFEENEIKFWITKKNAKIWEVYPDTWNLLRYQSHQFFIQIFAKGMAGMDIGLMGLSLNMGNGQT
ncbi:glycoside hydrolase [Rozella allomycis CSF55]|uniref:Glycoside hydrolase n=1 Tax=Rozella allomycis (strain CSF55) TaxID=988480 RepID=A0A075AW18_ROZAC|nr:Glycoside hydrolase, family 85 domain-containing protein [Rozella allomycis CSF55]RKP20598.1 glycoside hydrolase [Rozella allomycis CSF55]|eukprot:EPZ32719.1 Glycoside hydrolase, family 85 domain-containing protein [Rozella allomycis CSF55]